jgi:hypothetical protein
MTIGFQSYTDGGTLQIDSEKKCYVLKEAGTGTSDSTRVFILKIPKGISPLVFFHEADGALQSIFESSTQWFYVFYSFAPSQAVRFYHYDVISGSSPGPGLQLFNSAGEITFDANQRPLALHAAVSNVKPGTNASCSINTSRTYAVCTTTIPIVVTAVSSTSGNFFIPLPQRSGSNLVFTSWNFIGFETWSTSAINMAATTYLVIDVTDIPTPTWTSPGIASGYWEITEGFFGTLTGFQSVGTSIYGSIAGTTSYLGANIVQVTMSRFIVATVPRLNFIVSMVGNRAQNFWTNLNIIGYGTLTSASATRSYSATTNTTSWLWSNNIDVTGINGLGKTEGIFI